MDLETIENATGLESALKIIWADNSTLTSGSSGSSGIAVPVGRLFTGRVPPSEKMPYVRLEPEGGQEHTRTNLNLYSTEKINFHVWSDTFGTGRAIAALIRNAFASIAFDWGTGGVSDMKWDGPPISRQVAVPEIKAWETVVSFSAETWEVRRDTPAITSSSGD